MSFSQKLAESFGKPIEKTPFTAVDPIVKIQYVAKGNNVVFGRTLKDDDYSNLIYLGKILENSSGRNFFGADAWLDVTYPHVIYVTGTRGTGKSFDLGVLLEGISVLADKSPIQHEVQPITSILIDTQSQFWTLRYPPSPEVPQNAAQLRELSEWHISPNSLSNCSILIPPGTNGFLGTEKVLRLRPRDVTAEDWCALLNQPIYGPQGHIIGETLRHFNESDYSLHDVIQFIGDPNNWQGALESSRNAITYRLIEYERSGLFDPKGDDIMDLLEPGRCNVLMLRDLRNDDKSLVTAIVARRLFTGMGEYHSRKKVATFFKRAYQGVELPGRVWLLIDEAHLVAPAGSDSPARDALVEYVKRGRDAGLSLVLATQQPSAVDDRILSQVNVTFNHRLSFQSDINAAVNRIPTKTLAELKLAGTTVSDFGDMIRLLDVGQCFIGDHSTSRTVILGIRPRATAHGGYSPL
jgi:hypothetical protein